MRDYTATLRQVGIDPAHVDIHRIGAWQRVPTEDKPRKRNGDLMVFADRPLRFWCRNRATGIVACFSDDTSAPFLSRPDFGRVQRAKRDAQFQRELDQAEAARRLAEKAWHESKPADPQHPYLLRKQVKPHGVRELEDGYLVIPMRSSGLVWNVQTIAPDGEKRFLTGARKSGTYFGIGRTPTTTLLLAEGFATAATLLEALCLPVACCFDCGNLIHVGSALRQRYPHTDFVFCGDNDTKTVGNPGVRAATEAARATGGTVAYPQFGLSARKYSDWNDVAVNYGLEAVRQQFGEVLRVG